MATISSYARACLLIVVAAVKAPDAAALRRGLPAGWIQGVRPATEYEGAHQVVDQLHGYALSSHTTHLPLYAKSRFWHSLCGVATLGD
jgi:hypothetical protein